MAVQTKPRQELLTAEDFYRLPDPPHGGKMELVEGRVVTYMPVGRPHGRVALRTGSPMLAFADEHDLGECHVEVGHRTRREPDTVRAPDVSWISKDRLAFEAAAGFMTVPPNLAVEILSLDDTTAELTRKAHEYLAAGSDRVWLIRPDEEDVLVLRQAWRRWPEGRAMCSRATTPGSRSTDSRSRSPRSSAEPWPAPIAPCVLDLGHCQSRTHRASVSG